MRHDLYALILSWLEDVDAKAKAKLDKCPGGSESCRRTSKMRSKIGATRRNVTEIHEWERGEE